MGLWPSRFAKALPAGVPRAERLVRRWRRQQEERPHRVLRGAEQIATITVSRQSPDDAGIREIYVSVDSEQIAILKNGEAVTHDLPAGPHRIKVHNTLFWKSYPVVLQPGEHARFKAANKAGWGSFGFLMVLGAAPLYLTFEREN